MKGISPRTERRFTVVTVRADGTVRLDLFGTEAERLEELRARVDGIVGPDGAADAMSANECAEVLAAVLTNVVEVRLGWDAPAGALGAPQEEA